MPSKGGHRTDRRSISFAPEVAAEAEVATEDPLPDPLPDEAPPEADADLPLALAAVPVAAPEPLPPAVQMGGMTRNQCWIKVLCMCKPGMQQIQNMQAAGHVVLCCEV